MSFFRPLLLLFFLALWGCRSNTETTRSKPLIVATTSILADGIQQLVGDQRLGAEVHGEVRVVPVARHAQPLELLALHVDPVRGEGTAFLAEVVDGHVVLVASLLAILLLDLPLDGKAVAVPARHVVGIEALHLARAGDDVLEDLVEGVADVQVAVGVGGAVMQHVFGAAGRLLAERVVKVDRLPALQKLRLALRQTSLHGEAGLGQEHGVPVAVGLLRLVVGHVFGSVQIKCLGGF